jgi:hypothetical protein
MNDNNLILNAVRATTLTALFFLPTTALAQPKCPDYEACILDSIYPAGGQRGTTVKVNFHAAGSGMTGPLDILIDGPPGITVKGIEAVNGGHGQATLEIAPDAPLGRRMLRAVTRKAGMTNFCYFAVSDLAEVVENEQQDNNEPTRATKVTAPVVVNGRIREPLDIDCYQFEAKKGQNLVAAVYAHGLDSRNRGRNTRGFTDCSLELLDEAGRVLAEAEDTIGLDPVISIVAPADGKYIAKVYFVGYQGCPEAVYRLTLGEVPFPTSVFPPGGKLGSKVEVTYDGINIPSGTHETIDLAEANGLPQRWVTCSAAVDGRDLPFVHGTLTEAIEHEPNAARDQATPLEVGTTVNGRFDVAGDEDWYRLKLGANESVSLDLVAGRYLRSPVDTAIVVYDASGERVTGNDDAVKSGQENVHDFDTFDSGLTLKSKKAGDYYVHVTEQTGSHGPRAVYRLSADYTKPSFNVYQWPDGVPVWGPGTTASLYVTIERLTFGVDDIELSVEGLPSGWVGSQTLAQKNPVFRKYLLTITAPADAKVGDLAPFRVVARAKVRDQVVEQIAQPLTLYANGDRSQVRVSPISRAVVADPQTPWLTTEAREFNIAAGESLKVPVTIRDLPDGQIATLTGNQPHMGVQATLGVQMKLKPAGDQLVVPLDTKSLMPGRHGIVIAWAWACDTRKGMPGPCTPIIYVNVSPK